ncbi:MAG TPA: hypothetical protein VFH50_00865 [Acidimicrobiales bacterium]|nr:hypothetical protein [Acidimicrobiales bacterium]
MPSTVVLREPELQVQPGQEVTSEVGVLNTSDIVELFNLDVVGLPDGWATVEPPSVSLFPGASETVQVRLHPPDEPSTEAGIHPFAVRVVPTNAPGASCVEEGRLTVEESIQLGTELLPEVAFGRLRGKQVLAIDNRGNVPAEVSVVGTDAAGAVRILAEPGHVVVPSGRTQLVQIRIKPVQRIFRGPMRHRQYTVVVTPVGGEPVDTDGVLTQRPLLPKGAAILAIVGAVAGVWLLLLKPAIKNTAVQGANTALTQQSAQTQALSAQVANVNKQVTALSTTTTTVPTTTTTASTTTTTTLPPTTTTTVAPPTTTTKPFQGQLETVVQPGATGSHSFTVPKDDSVSLSSVLVQNVGSTRGVARLEELVPGQPTQTVLALNLANLNAQSFPLSPPLALAGGNVLSLVVSCNGNQPACDVSISYGGQITEPVAAGSGSSTGSGSSQPASTGPSSSGSGTGTLSPSGSGTSGSGTSGSGSSSSGG